MKLTHIFFYKPENNGVARLSISRSLAVETIRRAIVRNATKITIYQDKNSLGLEIIGEFDDKQVKIIKEYLD